MPTQAGGYRTADGKRVPSVTTITSRFKESGGLMYWANRIALEPLLEARALLQHVVKIQPSQLGGEDGASVDRFLSLDPDTWDHKKAAEKAADAGTIAHEMFDCYVRKAAFDATKYKPELVAVAMPAFEAGKAWAEQSRFEVTETEKPLVSEKYRFGGTRDAMLISGKRSLGDVKTSNSIYPEYLCQLAAYGILDEEAGNTIDGGYHLLRFSKQAKAEDPVQFTHYFWSHLDGPRKAFLIMRELYGLMAEIEKLAK